MAMAPPLTLTFSAGTPSSFINFIGTTAKASLTSNRSIWSTVMRARASAFFAAGAGPVSMMVGSAPVIAAATTRPRGVRPNSRPFFSLPIRIAAAPSTMPEELPAVWMWRMRSTWGYFCSATASKPILPACSNETGSAASASMVVPGRMVSSWSSTVSPTRSITGTMDLLK